MKSLKLFVFCALGCILVSCNAARSKWNKIERDSFEISLPDRMNEMTDLNEEAALQYGHIEAGVMGGDEHYLIVLVETKEEIAAYGLDLEFDAESYSDIAVEGMRDGLDEYEILTPEAPLDTINGLNCVKNAMRGKIGDIDVYYQLGVFEGEKAFYQVLSWTVADQKDKFKSDMEKAINSFKEV